MGYRERSLWVSLAAVALVDSGYFLMVLRGWLADAPLSAAQLVTLLVVIVVVLWLIELGFVLANRARREPMDERDKLIAAEAAHLAYQVFVGGVVLALAARLLVAAQDLNPGAGEAGEDWWLAALGTPYFEVHLILASLVSAELVRYAHALVRYRRER